MTWERGNVATSGLRYSWGREQCYVLAKLAEGDGAVHKKWNKFFNQINKAHWDYGPRAVRDTQSEDERLADVPLLATKDESRIFDTFDLNVEAKGRARKIILHHMMQKNVAPASKLAECLDEQGCKLPAGMIWSRRLAYLYVKRLNIEPPPYSDAVAS